MINAFMEVLWHWPLIAIIRAGRNTTQYGKGFCYAVVVQEKWWWWPFKANRFVIIKGLVAEPNKCITCEEWQKFSMAHARAILNILDRLDIKYDWERHKTSL